MSQSEATAENKPKPLLLPTPIDYPTRKLWNWLYNDVLGPTCEHNPETKRQAHWDGDDVPELTRHGGIDYQWIDTLSISTLHLSTGDRSYRQSHTATTDNPRPPFSMLTGCWFDLCLDMRLIGHDQWRSAVSQLERFKTWEQANEYGAAW